MNFIIFVLAITLATVSANVITHVTTASGRRIPLSAVDRHGVTASNARSLLYELSPTLHLTGHNCSLDLQTLTTSRALPASRLTVSVNGISRPDLVDVGELREGAGYHIVHADGSVVAIWGPDISLTAVDRIHHPGVLVRAKSSKGKHSSHHQGGLKKAPSFDIVMPKQNNFDYVRQALHSTSRAKKSSCKDLEVVKELELGVAFDNTYCDLSNNDEAAAVAALRAAVEVANRPYKEQTCIRLTISDIDAHCNDRTDPYRGYENMGATEIFRSFGQTYASNNGGIPGDAAMLVTGFDSVPSSQRNFRTFGIAALYGACGGHTWVGGANPAVMAHEVAHLLGGTHTKKGMIRFDNGGLDTMKLSKKTVKQMSSFVDGKKKSFDSTCLEEE